MYNDYLNRTNSTLNYQGAAIQFHNGSKSCASCKKIVKRFLGHLLLDPMGDKGSLS